MPHSNLCWQAQLISRRLPAALVACASRGAYLTRQFAPTMDVREIYVVWQSHEGGVKKRGSPVVNANALRTLRAFQWGRC